MSLCLPQELLPAVVAAGNGLSPAEIEAELAAVPEPQRKLAAMLPLSGLPPDWTIGKSGDHHLETFNADNLYEKIDGRAESFIQYGVKGMAYTFYHPTGDPSNELQLYVFEMGDSLKALGKYGSEKPEEFQTVQVGDRGLLKRRQLAFYCGQYYTQIVSTNDDPKFAAFALDLAKRVAARQATEAARCRRLQVQAQPLPLWLRPARRARPPACRGTRVARARSGYRAWKSRLARISSRPRRNEGHGDRSLAGDLLRSLAGAGPGGRSQVRRPGRFRL